jgi:hypothetical protein
MLPVHVIRLDIVINNPTPVLPVHVIRLVTDDKITNPMTCTGNTRVGL